MQLLARAESGEVLVLLAELVFEAEQFFAEALKPVAGLGEFGELGRATCEDLLNGRSLRGYRVEVTLGACSGVCVGTLTKA
jgi:hypothetical protein